MEIVTKNVKHELFITTLEVLKRKTEENKGNNENFSLSKKKKNTELDHILFQQTK